MFILTVLMVIAIVCMLVRRYIKHKRIIVSKTLDTIYDKMEMYVVKNDIRTNRSILDFLRRWKSFKVNNEYADIEILLLSYSKLSDKDHNIIKEKHKRELEKIPEELIIFGEEFSNELDKLVILSIFRTQFMVRFLIPSLMKLSFLALISFSTAPFMKLYEMLSKIRNEEIVIFGNYNQTSNCSPNNGLLHIANLN